MQRIKEVAMEHHTMKDKISPLPLTTQLKNATSRRGFLLLPLAGILSQLISTNASALDSISTRKVDPGCPLNSGGPTLLNTVWQVKSIYRNNVPSAMKLLTKINSTSLTGNSGCNNYTANFKRVGYTGFRVTSINKGKKSCRVIRPVSGGPTINVGDLEGGFLRTLRRMGSVQQLNNKLVFYNRSGERAIIMTKVS